MHVGDVEIHQRALHEKYGPIIRIAPDEVAISDPEVIPRVYPLQKPLEKTNWYHAWRPIGLPGQPDLFTQTNEKAHSAYRRVVGGVYGLSNVLKNEHKLDKTVELFMKRIDGFIDRKESMDFGLWLEMYDHKEKRYGAGLICVAGTPMTTSAPSCSVNHSASSRRATTMAITSKRSILPCLSFLF